MSEKDFPEETEKQAKQVITIIQARDVSNSGNGGSHRSVRSGYILDVF